MFDQLNGILHNYAMATPLPPAAWVFGEEDWCRVQASREPDIMVELGIHPTRVLGLPVMVGPYAAGILVGSLAAINALRSVGLIREIP